MDVRRPLHPEKQLDVEARMMIGHQLRLPKPRHRLLGLRIVQEKLPHQGRQIHMLRRRQRVQRRTGDPREALQRKVLPLPSRQNRIPESVEKSIHCPHPSAMPTAVTSSIRSSCVPTFPVISHPPPAKHARPHPSGGPAQHGFVAAQRRVAASQRGSVAAQRRVAASQRGSVAAQRRVAVSQRGSVTAQRRVVASQRGSVAAQRRVAPSQRGSVSAQRRVASSQRGSVAAQRRVAPPQRDSVTAQRRVALSQRDSVTAQRRVVTAQSDAVKAREGDE
jgi:hypothetical protein